MAEFEIVVNESPTELSTNTDDIQLVETASTPSYEVNVTEQVTELVSVEERATQIISEGLQGPAGPPGPPGDPAPTLVFGAKELSYNLQGQLSQVFVYEDGERATLMHTVTLTYDVNGRLQSVEKRDAANTLIATKTLVYNGNLLSQVIQS